jgi:hypothetical protein
MLASVSHLMGVTHARREDCGGTVQVSEVAVLRAVRVQLARPELVLPSWHLFERAAGERLLVVAQLVQDNALAEVAVNVQVLSDIDLAVSVVEQPPAGNLLAARASLPGAGTKIVT